MSGTTTAARSGSHGAYLVEEGLLALGHTSNSDLIRGEVDRQVEKLLKTPFFTACRAGRVGRPEMLAILPQLYTFSLYFERIITRRVATYSTRAEPVLLEKAREHMVDEIGHARMFHDVLRSVGWSSERIEAIKPSGMTKAVFGYMLATIDYDDALVTNVAIMQVLETIGQHFFSHSLEIMKELGLPLKSMQAHTEADDEHSLIGYDLYDQMDAKTLDHALHVVRELFSLMARMITSWLKD
jgi:hypothetical protein